MSQMLPTAPAGLGQGGGSLPPELLAALQGGTAPPGLSDQDADDGTNQGPPDPLQALQAVIQMLPSLISALPDPRDTQDAVKALHILAGIQTRLMGNGGGGGQGPSGGSGSSGY